MLYTNKKNRGFTFIEVLIALVIVSVALAAATTASSNATNNTSHLRDKIFAHWVADNRLTEIRIGKLFPGTGEQKSDTVKMGEAEWTWEEKVEKTDDENLRRVTVYVYKSEAEEKKPITFLTALVLNPSQISKN